MRWLILFGLWLCYLAFGLTAASIAPLVERIQAELLLSHSAMGSIMGAWQLVYIAAAVPCGVLLDRLGPRAAITIGVALICLSGLGRAAADSYWTLLTAVMAFGVGGPIVSSGAPKVVAALFRDRQRGMAMGIYMTGPTLGGILALTLSHAVLLPLFDGEWRPVLRLWGLFAGAGAAIWLAISAGFGRSMTGLNPEPRTRGSRPDAGGGVIASLLRSPSVRLVLVMSVGVFLFNHGLNSWLPVLLRHRGMTAVSAGYWAALPMAVGLVGSLTLPRLATPARRYPLLAALCGAACLASLLLTIANPAVLGSALVLQGIVRSALMTVLMLTLIELPDVGERRAGTASGLFFSAAEVGGVGGPLGLGVLYDLTGGFRTGLVGLAVMSLGLVAAVNVLSRRAPPP